MLDLVADTVLMSAESRRQIPRVQWLRRLASRRRDRTAFVLSGGGPYGALQAGALRALVEAGIQPDLIVGTSVGALNGVFLATEPGSEGIARLRDVWLELRDEDLFPGVRRRSSWARMLMRGNRIFDNTGLSNLIESRLGIETFEEADLPIGIVATDLETGKDVVFSSGPIAPPLLASAAMPGIYPPVEIDGRFFIDGGVTNSVPMAPAVEMGAGRIYVLNCSGSNQERRPLHRPMDYLLHAFMLARSQRFERDLADLRERVEIVNVPSPNLGFAVPFTSLDHSEMMLRLGYETAARFLERRASADREPQQTSSRA